MEANAKIWRWFFIAVFTISTLMPASTYMTIASTPLAIPPYWAVIAGMIIFIVAAGLTLLSGHTKITNQTGEQNYITVFGSYIGRPLDAGRYWLFPWLDLVKIHYLPKGSRTIVVMARAGFLDYPVTVPVEAEFEITDPIKLSFGGGGLDTVEKLIKGRLESFLSLVMNLEHAIVMQKRFFLNSVTGIRTPKDWDKIYLHDAYRPKSDATDPFPSEEDLLKYSESDTFFPILKSMGVRIISLNFPDFAKMMQEIKAQEEREERQRREEERLAEIDWYNYHYKVCSGCGEVGTKECTCGNDSDD